MAFPQLRTGRVAMYPLQMTTSYQTTVVQFYDDTEQRYAERNDFHHFEIAFSSLDAYELEKLYNFWNAAKGAYDSTWDITFNQEEGTWLLGADPGAGGVTYSDMAFVDDDFKVVESKPDRYSVSLRCVQTRND